MSVIELPTGSLVVLIGVAGAGKTTFAARHFQPSQVLSSDAFRAMVADDPADQRASRAAFELLHLATRRRLERRLLTVIDATNVTRPARRQLVAIAQAARRPAVAIVFDLPLELALRWNALRPGRTVAPEVVERQARAFRRSVAEPDELTDEGFVAVHRLVDPAGVSAVRVVRPAGPLIAGAPDAGTGTIPTTPSRRPKDRRATR